MLEKTRKSSSLAKYRLKSIESYEYWPILTEIEYTISSGAIYFWLSKNHLLAKCFCCVLGIKWNKTNPNHQPTTRTVLTVLIGDGHKCLLGGDWIFHTRTLLEQAHVRCCAKSMLWHGRKHREEKNNSYCKVIWLKTSGWFPFQPIWKICSSKWLHLPQISRWKIPKNVWVATGP